MGLKVYNTLSRTKEDFKPLHPPLVGLYVCGPTVYSDVHLGNCRTFVSFDVIFRYLKHKGYKVRYVRNITDAGHLEGDRDEGDDKFAKKAKLEKLEPMEVVQKYTLGFHDVLRSFNTLPPSIEPTATGHISEQIEMVRSILDKGLAYEVNGTVYFDVEKYSKKEDYGQLTNRKLEDLVANSRELSGQDEKKGRLDFALWIKAKPEHIMRWPSPWGWGFPGWHIECSAMSSKYLGDQFDIHGGGMDLQATHHTNEIAQSKACSDEPPVKYWMHTNMLTVNGARMSKSAGNFILPNELFSGEHDLLEKGFDPMTVRFFMLQTHYRSTLDFSNDALAGSEKGFDRLMEAIGVLSTIKPSQESNVNVKELVESFELAMDDDFNTPVLIARLFDGVKLINSANNGKEKLTEEDLGMLQIAYHNYVYDVLGLKERSGLSKKEGSTKEDALLKLLVSIRNQSKKKKDFETSDLIRNELKALKIQLKDTPEGTTWEYEK